MTKLTGVGTVISVGHNSPEGVPHGHSYEVVAWFPHGSDARDLLAELEAVTKPLCHTFLPDHMRFGEDIAEHVASSLTGCVEVEVRRPLERIYAKYAGSKPLVETTEELARCEAREPDHVQTGSDHP